MIMKSGSVAAIKFVFPSLVHAANHLHLGNIFHVLQKKSLTFFGTIFPIPKNTPQQRLQMEVESVSVKPTYLHLTQAQFMDEIAIFFTHLWAVRVCPRQPGASLHHIRAIPKEECDPGAPEVRGSLRSTALKEGKNTHVFPHTSLKKKPSGECCRAIVGVGKAYARPAIIWDKKTPRAIVCNDGEDSTSLRMGPLQVGPLLMLVDALWSDPQPGSALLLSGSDSGGICCTLMQLLLN